MRALVLALAFATKAICFDLSAIDTSNANWLPSGESAADINVLVKSNVKGLFERADSFPFRYVSPKTVVSANGNKHSNYVGSFRKNIPDFNANGNLGWIYVKALSDEGAHIRCVVRESKDAGKTLYEREFLIPWSTRVFSLDTGTEHFDARITVKSDKT
ncbi:MAG: hypothetical protein SFU53_12440 [Terrimicrobiaceae bacterium]|nr:hypothetical protein [Terrimicrobiaceae bacterium]